MPVRVSSRLFGFEDHHVRQPAARPADDPHVHSVPGDNISHEVEVVIKLFSSHVDRVELGTSEMKVLATSGEA